jgi:hypothetical protein
MSGQLRYARLHGTSRNDVQQRSDPFSRAMLTRPRSTCDGGRVSAAHLWGADLRPRDSTHVEVTVPGRTGPRTQRGLTVVHSPLLAGDVDLVRGVLVTTAARTAFDLARRSSYVEAVIACDALLHVAPRDLAELEQMVRDRTWPGTAHLPRVLAAIDPRSESPMETRVRLVLVGGGLPPPVSQYGPGDVFNRARGVVAEVRAALAG